MYVKCFIILIIQQKLGHIMKDCRAPFNIHNMTYEELRDHFNQTKVAKKDREAIRAKEQKEKDFSSAAQ